MHAKLGWEAEVPGLFCATFAPPFGGKRHMVVESIPGGGWDWAVWANDGSGRCVTGRAETPEGAMEAAEHGAVLLTNAPEMADLPWGLHFGMERLN